MSSKSKGFSLIELMVVLSIVNLLASFSLLSVKKYKIKAAQAEAKYGLNAIRMNAESSLASEVGAINYNLAGLKLTGPHLRYQYATAGSSDFKYGILAYEKGSCSNRAISNYCVKGDLQGASGLGLFTIFDTLKCTGAADFSGYDSPVVIAGIGAGLNAMVGFGNMQHHATSGCP